MYKLVPKYRFNEMIKSRFGTALCSKSTFLPSAVNKKFHKQITHRSIYTVRETYSFPEDVCTHAYSQSMLDWRISWLYVSKTDDTDCIIISTAIIHISSRKPSTVDIISLAMTILTYRFFMAPVIPRWMQLIRRNMFTKELLIFVDWRHLRHLLIKENLSHFLLASG